MMIGVGLFFDDSCIRMHDESRLKSGFETRVSKHQV